MKTYFEKFITMAGLLVVLFLGSCKKDFLEVPPLGSLNEKNLANSEGVDRLLTGAYSLLDGVGGAGSGNGISSSNWVFGSIASDEAYKGSTLGDLPDIMPIETYSATPSNSLFNSKWRVLYDAIQRCNDVLRIMALAEDMTAAQKSAVAAEVRFLRGHYHFEAKKMWNQVPYVDETITYAANNLNVPNNKDIWPEIEADFKYAVENLPATQPLPGRANSWAAKAYLSKVYVFQGKFVGAKSLLTEVINSGVTSKGQKYGLIRFPDNFNAAHKNSAESIFAVQFSVNDNADGRNGNRGDRLNGPYNWGPLGGSGFFQPSQSLVNSFRVDENGLPFLDTFNELDVKNDQGLTSIQPFTPDHMPLDPRLDWTVGRRGIPYLDWGNHPGQSAVREQATGGPYAPIKTVYYKSQQGVLSDASAQYGVHTANNYAIIRFSDVLLMAAEAEAQTGDLGRATELVNQVRQRASDPGSWVHKYIDPNAPEKGFSQEPAANYKIGLYPVFGDLAFALKAIRFERKLELAMEGHRFFDLVRSKTAGTELSKYIAKEKTLRAHYSTVTFTEGKNEYFPIPQAQIDLSRAVLQQNPGY